MIKYVLVIFFSVVNIVLYSSSPNINQLLNAAVATTPSIVTASKSQDALSVLMDQANTGTGSEPVVHHSRALQFFIAQQNNISYKKAVEIITNPAYKKRYRFGLLNMQMFFLEYASSTLRTLAQQHEKNTTPSLQSVLDTFAGQDNAAQSDLNIVSVRSLMHILDSSVSSAQSTPDGMNNLVQSMLHAVAPAKLQKQNHAAGVQYLLHIVQDTVPVQSKSISAQQILAASPKQNQTKKIQTFTASSLLKQV